MDHTFIHKDIFIACEVFVAMLPQMRVFENTYVGD